ncbi:hypothetical protein PCH_Pc18g04040 [Penicillium rubens Wisconsin 54-1255]|uniref:Uncharacterized protein n=1 Tax=Penicillium rubens (strain ATCC 28089 / DSM 1075 / NRRL 1951 / Wisconsin 54-1255) TaxID=500485 RepID=B6HBG8_PENRW|nr:hypothetical protein PCH_Pc18g04040 [Penicillium rubens Wisconsin 54-1255]
MKLEAKEDVGLQAADSCEQEKRGIFKSKRHAQVRLSSTLRDITASAGMPREARVVDDPPQSQSVALRALERSSGLWRAPLKPYLEEKEKKPLNSRLLNSNTPVWGWERWRDYDPSSPMQRHCSRRAALDWPKMNQNPIEAEKTPRAAWWLLSTENS